MPWEGGRHAPPSGDAAGHPAAGQPLPKVRPEPNPAWKFPEPDLFAARAERRPAGPVFGKRPWKHRATLPSMTGVAGCLRVAAMSKKTGWNGFAFACARQAHEHDFSARRGIYLVEDAKDASGAEEGKPEDDVLVIFNNNPFAGHAIARDWEVEELRRLLAEAGVKELGYAEYPDTGEDEGYSFAMVVDATRDQEDQVAELVDQAAMAAERKIEPDKP